MQKFNWILKKKKLEKPIRVIRMAFLPQKRTQWFEIFGIFIQLLSLIEVSFLNLCVTEFRPPAFALSRPTLQMGGEDIWLIQFHWKLFFNAGSREFLWTQQKSTFTAMKAPNRILDILNSKRAFGNESFHRKPIPSTIKIPTYVCVHDEFLMYQIQWFEKLYKVYCRSNRIFS